MKNYFSLSVLVVILVSASLISWCSQDDKLITTCKSNPQGLSSDKIGKSIMKIYEDRSGNLWFGTKGNGVAKFDGKSLECLTTEDGLCGNDVANITEDNFGNMWFGTHTDMCKYDGNSFTSFPRDDEGVPTLGWGWKSVDTDRNGEIWVNSHHGIFKCSNNADSGSEIKFTKFDLPLDLDKKENSSFCNTPGIASLDLHDSKGNMWFGTDGLGAYMFDGKKYTQFTKEDGLPSNNVTGIVEDDNGNIWFSCREGLVPNNMHDGGIAVYDGVKIINFPNVNSLSGTNVFTIFADSKSNIWAIAKDVGVYKFNGSDFKLYNLPNEHIPSDDFGTNSILEDRNGKMWFGFSGDLFRLDDEVLITVFKDGPWS